MSGMNWRPWGTDGRDGGPGCENHLWLMRTGNCWHEALHWTTGRGFRWPQLWGGEEKSCPSTRIQTGPYVERPSFLSLPVATFALYYRWGFRAQGTEGGTEASPLEEGTGKEALECSRLRQPGLRHGAGQQHPRTMGLEHGAGMGTPLASSPTAVVPASNFREWSLQ